MLKIFSKFIKVSLVIANIFVWSTLALAKLTAEEGLEGLPIAKIDIQTKRIKEETVRQILFLREDQPFKFEDLERTRLRLDALKFFKKIDITVEKNSTSNGVLIHIYLVDGWFIFPIPFFLTGSGGAGGSIMILERNIFKKAETVSILGGGNRDGNFGVVGIQLERFEISANYGRRGSTEFNYENNAFTTSGLFRSSRDISSPEQYGVISNQYDKTVETSGFQTHFPLSAFSFAKRMGASLGFSSQGISYSNPVIGFTPKDQGRNNILIAGLDYSLKNVEDRSGLSDQNFSLQDLGAAFGYGMADVKNRIQPLSKRQLRLDTNLSVTDSDRSFGSDFNWTVLRLGFQPSLTLPNHEKFYLNLIGASALREDLPVSQSIATSHQLGMKGNYAREFRGDRGVGASWNFSYPFRKTVRGVWTGTVFLEGSTIWNSGASFYKEGTGVALNYQFWRFPLPVGFLYSYSIDDRDGRFNIAFGGRF